MGIKRIILLFLFFLAVYRSLPAQSVEIYTEALKAGLSDIEQGNIDRALNRWTSLIDRHSGDSLTDPRIGIRLIQEVTELGRTEKYDAAYEGYVWGLTRPQHPEFREELSSEIKRLKPIVSRNTYRRWNSMLKEERLDALGESILLFWDRLDPTLDTPFNERLVEHWERIAYAKENYNRGRNTVYETDDRALIYVRFGEPDRTRDGTIGYNPGLVQMWIQDALKMSMAPEMPRHVGSDSASRAMAKMQMQISLARKRAQLANFEREVRFKHTYPRYEIWVYYDLTPNNRNLIYIFGSDGDTGQFGLRRSMEELFPNSAYRSDQLGMGLPPSFFLQLLYYQEVITVDNYFADAFNELESRIYNLQGLTRWDSHQMRSRNYSRLIQAQLRAPSQRSTILNTLPEIPLDVYQYRLLDDRGNPYLATFLFSHPYRAYYYDQMKLNAFNDPGYRLAGFVQATDERDKALYKIKSTQKPMRIFRDYTGRIDDMEPQVHYFKVPNLPDSPRQKFTVELRHTGMDSSDFGDRLFKENIRALGTKTAEQTEPLEGDPSELLMGDLIVGVNDSQTDPGSRPYGGNPFGFLPEPDATIDNGQNLIVHLEVYNLGGRANAPVPFQIEYTVTEKKGLLKRLFGKRDRIRLALNFEARSSTFRENLEIDTTPFGPGDYTLELLARRPGTEKQTVRSLDFTIRERD